MNGVRVVFVLVDKACVHLGRIRKSTTRNGEMHYVVKFKDHRHTRFTTVAPADRGVTWDIDEPERRARIKLLQRLREVENALRDS